MRETSSERKGEATAPAMASERATALLALVLMARIISKIFRAVLWVPVAALHHTSNDHLRTHGTSPRETLLNGERPSRTTVCLSWLCSRRYIILLSRGVTDVPALLGFCSP